MNKYIASLIAFSSLLYVILGSLYIKSYYEHLSINIFNFATLDEVIVQSLVPVTTVVFSIIYSCSILFLLYLVFYSLDLKISDADGLYRLSKGLIEHAFIVSLFFKTALSITVLFLMFYMYMNSFIDVGMEFKFSKAWITVSVLIVCIINTVHMFVNEGKYELITKTNIMAIAVCLLLNTPFSVIEMAKIDYNDAEKNNAIIEATNIKTENRPKDDAVVRYMGGTKNFVFLKGLQSKATYVVEMKNMLILMFNANSEND